MELIKLEDFDISNIINIIKQTGQWDDFLDEGLFEDMVNLGIVYQIYLNEVGMIGYYLLYNYQPHISVEESLYIYPEFQGKWVTRGRLKQIRDLTTSVAFDELNVERIVGTVIESNTRSRKLTELMGLTQEGILRNTRCIDGQLHNLVIYSMLRRER